MLHLGSFVEAKNCFSSAVVFLVVLIHKEECMRMLENARVKLGSVLACLGSLGMEDDCGCCAAV